MTVRDLIKSTLRLIGVISSGEDPTASELQDALLSLNMMIKSWSNERLMLYSLVREVFPLVIDQGLYTVGSGGDFDTARPAVIVKAAIGTLNVNEVDFETAIEVIDYQRWVGQSMKTVKGQPQALYPEGLSPLEKIHLLPIPNEALGLVLYSKKALDSFANADVVLDLPDGYEEALKYNLALRAAIEFSRPVDPTIAKIANDAKAAIKRQNNRVPLMKSDAAGLGSRGSFNIYSGGS